MPKPQTALYDVVQTLSTALQTTLGPMRQELASMNSALQTVIATQNKPTNSSFSFRQIGLFLLAAGGATAAYFYFNNNKQKVSSPNASMKEKSDAEIQTEYVTTNSATTEARAILVDASIQTGETIEEKEFPAATQGGLFSRSPSPLNLTSHQDSPVNSATSTTTTNNNSAQVEAGGSWWPSSWQRK